MRCSVYRANKQEEGSNMAITRMPPSRRGCRPHSLGPELARRVRGEGRRARPVCGSSEQKLGAR